MSFIMVQCLIDQHLTVFRNRPAMRVVWCCWRTQTATSHIENQEGVFTSLKASVQFYHVDSPWSPILNSTSSCLQPILVLKVPECAHIREKEGMAPTFLAFGYFPGNQNFETVDGWVSSEQKNKGNCLSRPRLLRSESLTDLENPFMCCCFSGSFLWLPLVEVSKQSWLF